MANPEHLAILKQGANRWDDWRKEHPDVVPDLCGAELERADWGDLDLSRADLTMANLYLADLGCAVLDGASLARAYLNGVDFDQAGLRDANLSQTRLFGAQFQGSDLRGTDFTKAYAGSTVFAYTDLSCARGLEDIEHHWPSTIGIDTIYKSKGKIPEVFLRGCGVPDDMISYIKSIAGAIQFYSCFISYSTKDQEFADRLYADLQAKGVRCWFAPHDIRGGRKMHEQIDEAIRLHDKLLLILSEHSMSSDWVGTKIANARQREAKEKKQMMFPLTLVPFDEVRN